MQISAYDDAGDGGWNMGNARRRTKDARRPADPAARVAAALRRAAERFHREWKQGKRSWAVDGGDLIEMFERVANDLDAKSERGT
jgi:hypothetical protein